MYYGVLPRGRFHANQVGQAQPRQLTTRTHAGLLGGGMADKQDDNKEQRAGRERGRQGEGSRENEWEGKRESGWDNKREGEEGVDISQSGHFS